MQFYLGRIVRRENVLEHLNVTDYVELDRKKKRNTRPHHDGHNGQILNFSNYIN